MSVVKLLTNQGEANDKEHRDIQFFGFPIYIYIFIYPPGIFIGPSFETPNSVFYICRFIFLSSDVLHSIVCMSYFPLHHFSAHFLDFFHTTFWNFLNVLTLESTCAIFFHLLTFLKHLLDLYSLIIHCSSISYHVQSMLYQLYSLHHFSICVRFSSPLFDKAYFSSFVYYILALNPIFKILPLLWQVSSDC